MSLTNDLVRLANSANVLATAISTNSTAITAISVGGYTVNTSGMSINSTSTNTFTVGTGSYFVANGNLGVGTSSPGYKLDVYSATSSTFTLQGDSAVSGLSYRASADTSASTFTFRKARGSVASPAAVSSGDTSGSLVYSVYGGTNTRNVAAIRASVETYTSDTDISGYLWFQTASAGGTTLTERMRIDSSGNVGIGTSSPAAKLDVNGTTYHQGNVILGSSSVAVGLQANSSYGTAGQVLTSNGTATYWSTTIGKTIAMAIVFGG